MSRFSKAKEMDLSPVSPKGYKSGSQGSQKQTTMKMDMGKKKKPLTGLMKAFGKA